jgi:hypothetical protein
MKLRVNAGTKLERSESATHAPATFPILIFRFEGILTVKTESEAQVELQIEHE